MSIQKKHVPGCGCCGGGCTTVTDALTDGTVSPFTEESGSWSSSASGFLTYSAPAQAIYPSTSTGSHYHSYVFVDFTADVYANNDYRLIFGWTDTSNYWYAKIELDAFGISAYIYIGQVASGVDTELAGPSSAMPSATGYLHICIDSTTAKAYRTQTAGGTIETGTDVSYTNAAIGSIASRFGLGTTVNTAGKVFITWSLEYGDTCSACP